MIEKITVSLTNEVLKELDRQAETAFGDRKGKRSLYLEMLLRNHFKMNIELEEVKGVGKEGGD